MKKIADVLFFDKFTPFMLAILQLAMSIGYINYYFMVNNTYRYGYNDTYNFQNMCYCVNNSNDVLVNNLKTNDCTVEYNYYPFEKENVKIYAYDKNTFNNYNNYIINGKYQSSSYGTVNCLVVGQKSLYKKTLNININGNDYKFYIVGVIDKNAKNIKDYNGSGERVMPLDIFENYNLSNINIICLSDDVNEFTEQKSNKSALIYFGENKDKSNTKIDLNGFMLQMEELRYNLNTNGQYLVVNSLFYVAIGVGLVSIISIICILIITINVNITEFCNYNKNGDKGIKKGYMFGVICILSLYFYVAVIPLSAIFGYVWSAIIYVDYPLAVGFDNIIFSVCYLIIIFVINYIISYLILFKNKFTN